MQTQHHDEVIQSSRLINIPNTD